MARSIEEPYSFDVFGPDCRCWCQVRPIVCTLSGCGCVVHDHRGGSLSLNVDIFQKSKRVISLNPIWGDEQVADAIGERLAICQQIIQEARKDLEADKLQPPTQNW